MFYKQTPVKITLYGLAAGCRVFYRKIYGFFTVYPWFTRLNHYFTGLEKTSLN